MLIILNPAPAAQETISYMVLTSQTTDYSLQRRSSMVVIILMSFDVGYDYIKLFQTSKVEDNHEANVRSHIGWGGERNFLYKGVETSL